MALSQKTLLWRVYSKKRRALESANQARFDKLGNRILMLLSFEEFYDLLLSSGHINDYGKGKGKYCLSRNNDIGHYAVGNVSIKPFTENTKEGRTGVKETPEQIAAKIKRQTGKTKAQQRIKRAV